MPFRWQSSAQPRQFRPRSRAARELRPPKMVPELGLTVPTSPPRGRCVATRPRLLKKPRRVTHLSCWCCGAPSTRQRCCWRPDCERMRPAKPTFDREQHDRCTILGAKTPARHRRRRTTCSREVRLRLKRHTAATRCAEEQQLIAVRTKHTRPLNWITDSPGKPRTRAFARVRTTFLSAALLSTVVFIRRSRSAALYHVTARHGAEDIGRCFGA